MNQVPNTLTWRLYISPDDPTLLHCFCAGSWYSDEDGLIIGMGQAQLDIRDYEELDDVPRQRLQEEAYDDALRDAVVESEGHGIDIEHRDTVFAMLDELGETGREFEEAWAGLEFQLGTHPEPASAVEAPGDYFGADNAGDSIEEEE